jgi:hypothetical protein
LYTFLFEFPLLATAFAFPSTLFQLEYIGAVAALLLLLLYWLVAANFWSSSLVIDLVGAPWIKRTPNVRAIANDCTIAWTTPNAFDTKYLDRILATLVDIVERLVKAGGR